MEFESLNPNSRFHLALRVGYPNGFDNRMASQEGRTNLGGDIMVHGGSASIGCLAMGDEASEDLFVLVALVGKENSQIVLSPVDFRVSKLPDGVELPTWSDLLYAQIRAAIDVLPKGSQSQ